MPGIFGFAWKKQHPIRESLHLLGSMSQAIGQHNGYTEEISLEGRVGLGRRGHTILGCQQPFRRNGFWTLLAGQIDDYGNGRLSENGILHPPELLTMAYEEWSEGVVKRLKGQFHAAIYDELREVLILFNDRFGFRPLYLYEDGEILLFAPELKPLLCYQHLDRTLDSDGLADFFNYSFALGDRTFFKNVRLLPPASLLRLQDGKTEIRRYWQLRYHEDEHPQFNLDDLADCGLDLLRSSVRRRTGSSSHISIMLSGGLDSRAILSLATESPVDVETYTHGAPGCWDEQIASQVVTFFPEVRHRFLPIDPDTIAQNAHRAVWLSEGMSPCTNSFMVTNAHEIAQRGGLLLSSLFGGHLSFGSGYYHAEDPCEPLPIHTAAAKIQREAEWMEPWMADLVLTPDLAHTTHRRRMEGIEQELEQIGDGTQWFCHLKDAFFILNRLRKRIAGASFLPTFIETVYPFADYALFDFYLALPSQVRLGHRLYRQVYIRRFPHLALIPWQKTGVDLKQMPSRCARERWRLTSLLRYTATRISHGRLNPLDPRQYVHFDQWYRSRPRVKQFVHDILTGSRTRQRGLFRIEGIDKLLKLEQSGRSYFAFIAALLNVEIWCRFFIDGDDPPSFVFTSEGGGGYA
jgi:asparagine synthase (glutamine-hydrolysing)